MKLKILLVLIIYSSLKKLHFNSNIQSIDCSLLPLVIVNQEKKGHLVGFYKYEFYNGS